MTEIDYDLEDDEDEGFEGEEDALPAKKKNGKEKNNVRKSELS